ncbi:haloacid dehalogenase [Paracoccidioides lutzii Pb01]|uniref:Haloacid dehalogenase n=1 Tax=Paracoccidioides lutzii (strain ATCC MYA-826 / Pb01) TaxID=502779 RepID=C1HA30_PARBA|nr:haloacid dehalogenase [Paracoccidioides lutzii Pb01]EEH37203.1 haloacid dehalogenase [Paracoccidioides lutzii Pb01]
MTSNRLLASFQLLSFDIYGTLIDWERGIIENLKPLTDRLSDSHPSELDPLALCSSLNKYERAFQAENPRQTYDLILKASYEALAKELQALPAAAGGEDPSSILDKEGTAFGTSIGTWPAFPDTVEAMRKLKKRYKLVPLTNVDRVSFQRTLQGPLGGVHEGLRDGERFFDAVYTAQDVGSYKPNPKNFDYLLSHVKSEFGLEKDQVLHVAQSLFHDHVPAKKYGLQSAWIARGEGGGSGMGGKVVEYLEGENPKVAFGWRFNTLGELAEAVEREAEKEAEKDG